MWENLLLIFTSFIFSSLFIHVAQLRCIMLLVLWLRMNTSSCSSNMLPMMMVSILTWERERLVHAYWKWTSILIYTLWLNDIHGIPHKMVLITLHLSTYVRCVWSHAVERHHHMLSTAMGQYNDSQRVMRRYHIGNFRGYSAHLSAQWVWVP